MEDKLRKEATELFKESHLGVAVCLCKHSPQWANLAGNRAWRTRLTAPLPQQQTMQRMLADWAHPVPPQRSRTMRLLGRRRRRRTWAAITAGGA